MNQSDSINVLNRLLRIVYRSLPVYLAETRPWSLRGSEQAVLIENVAQSQLDLAGRIADAIVRQGGGVESGSFPLEYTATHDLSMGYLLKRVAQHQVEDIAAIEQCVADLSHSVAFRPLAEEALGAARGHLDNLKETMNDE